MNNPARVAIVGGGLYGACTAYELAKGGCQVVLIERDRICAHASGRNPGNLNPILATPPALRPFAMASFRLHEMLRLELSELGCRSYHSEQTRRVLVSFGDDDRRELEEIASEFNAHPGFAASWLDETALHGLDSRLAPELTGGLLIEGNRSLDSCRFNSALLEGAAKLGATQIHGNVTSVSSRARGGYTLDTDQGPLECDLLVLATGPWVAEIRTWFGVDLPVSPVKGEMLRMRLQGAGISCDFTHGLISLYRRGDDEVWVGVTRQSCGFDEQPSLRARQQLLEGAALILPGIADAEYIEQMASLRPMTPEGSPLIGRLPGQQSVYVANGGGIKGVLTSAGAGRALADTILTGETPLPIEPFSP